VVSEARGDEDEGAAPHPRGTFTLYGHQGAETALLESYRSGRIPHAWLIGGSVGIGKATLAYRLARFVLTHPDPMSDDVQAARTLATDPQHAVSRRIAGRAHPDLLTLERGYGDTGKLRKFIEVDEVRRSVTFFGSTAGEGGWRIAIVDAIDELNSAGENALLKVLEEPPPRSLLFLVSHSPGSTLATIRSRCRRLLLRPLDVEEVARATASALGRDRNDDEIKGAAAAAEGSVARALALLDGETFGLRQRVLSLLEKLPTVDMRALHALSDSMSGADPRVFATFVETLNTWLSSQLIGDMREKARLARLAEVWEKVNRTATEAETYNLDRKPIIFTLFGLLAEAAQHQTTSTSRG
jgi:DNA polymerase-3 subunit delta'